MSSHQKSLIIRILSGFLVAVVALAGAALTGSSAYAAPTDETSLEPLADSAVIAPVQEQALGPASIPGDFVYETTFNGAFLDSGTDIAIDAEGNAYVVAYAYQNTNDVLVLKVGPDGDVLWVVSLSGGGLDYAGAIAFDDGYVYVAGRTNSADFPIVNAMQPSIAGFTDTFISKLSAADGAIVFSTYFGGDRYDFAHDISISPAGDILLTGTTASTDFPTVDPYQAQLNTSQCFCDDAFVSRISADGSTLLYSTYLGGAFDDAGVTIGADATGRYLLAGTTTSADFPLAAPIQPSFGGGLQDVFVTALSGDGASLDYSTFVGGEDTEGVGELVVDGSGNVTLVGATRSVAFPTSAGAFQEGFVGGINACGDPPFDPLHNCPDAFATQIVADGSAFAYSTFLGGGFEDEAHDVALDAAGRAYIVGYTRSADFPPDGVVSPASMIVSRLGADGASLDYTIEFDTISPSSGRGIAVDSSGDIYVTGADHVPDDIYVARLRGEAPISTLHVDAIHARRYPANGAPLTVRADVYVTDQSASPLSNAQVMVEVSLPGGGAITLNATTDGRGRASFDPTAPEAGQGTFCVTSIALEGYDYNPADNNLTCLDITFQ
jgi:hypothetical protein